MEYVTFYRVKSVQSINYIFYAPTLKKVKGHIALGLSVRASVRYKFKIGFWNFIDGFLIKNN